MHYVAAVCADGRFLPAPYTTENAHRGCQLAEDVEDAWVSARRYWWCSSYHATCQPINQPTN